MRRSSVVPALLMAAALVTAYPGVLQTAGDQISERDQWAADLDLLAKELPG